MPILPETGIDGVPVRESSDEDGQQPGGDLQDLPKACTVRPLTVRSLSLEERRERARGDSGIDAERDTVLIAELDGKEVGSMSVRVLPLVHGMEIEPGLVQRKVADALFFYASGYVKASGFNEALVLVGQENKAMQGYVEARAIPEEVSQVYVMGVQ